MAYHVPFHLRNENRAEKPPVYIGFEVPRRRRRRFSLIGFGGFLLCLFTCGALAPFTLVMSLIGLRRGPNFFSVAGTVLSSLALIGMAMGFVGTSIESAQQKAHYRYVVESRKIEKQNDETRSIMIGVEKEFRAFKAANENRLPAPMEGNLMAVNHQDAWGQELRYEVETDFALLRSAGADQEFDTADDLTRKIAGKPILEYDISVDSDIDTE